MKQNKTIICVLRSGGVYGADYVRKLNYAAVNASKKEIRFVCLTDFDSIDFCEVIPLKHKWPGWWSKIELFRPDLNLGKAIYFDLDVLILKEIEALINISEIIPFAMLRGWNTKSGIHPSSSIMCGRFDMYSNIYEVYKKNPKQERFGVRQNKGAGMSGDQGFITEFVGYDVPYLQDLLPDDYIIGKQIYKADSSLINDAHILSWSGSPRLHTVKKLWDNEIIHPVSDKA